MMMRPGDILGRIFYVVTEINHRIIGIYPRNYFGSCFARNLWRKSLIKIWPMARNQSSEFRRNLYGFY